MLFPAYLPVISRIHDIRTVALEEMSFISEVLFPSLRKMIEIRNDICKSFAIFTPSMVVRNIVFSSGRWQTGGYLTRRLLSIQQTNRIILVGNKNFYCIVIKFCFVENFVEDFKTAAYFKFSTWISHSHLFYQKCPFARGSTNKTEHTLHIHKKSKKQIQTYEQ